MKAGFGLLFCWRRFCWRRFPVATTPRDYRLRCSSTL
jgi:hypothetical protein